MPRGRPPVDKRDLPDDRTPKEKKANYTGGRPKDESKLSTKPSQVRIRLRRAARSNKGLTDQVKRDIEILYRKPLDEWDVEELAKGMPRREDGTWSTGRPGWIGLTMQNEIKKRLLNHTFGGLAAQTDLAVKTIKELMTSTDVDDKGKPLVDARTRLAAAQFVIEHIIGKPTAVVEIGTGDVTKQAIASAIVLDDGKPEDHFILEGQYEEHEPEDDDDSSE